MDESNIKHLIKECSDSLEEFFNSSGIDENALLKYASNNPELEKYTEGISKHPDGLKGMLADLHNLIGKLTEPVQQPEKAAETDATNDDIGAFEQSSSENAPCDFIPGMTRDAVLKNYKTVNKFDGLDCSGLDLSHMELTGINFSGCVLSGTNFEESNLTNAVFDRSIITNVNFNKAVMVCASVKESNASYSTFDFTDLSRSILDSTDFTGATFENSKLDHSHAKYANFSDTRISGLNASKFVADLSNFSEAHISNSDFTYGRFRNTNFFGAKIESTNFEGGHLLRVDLSNASIVRSSFNSALMHNSESNAMTSMTQTSFFKSDLTGAFWQGTLLQACDLSRATANGSDFTLSTFGECKMINLVATNAVFDRAVIQSSDLTGMNLLRGAMRGAIISESKLDSGNYFLVDFQDTTLENSSLIDSNIQQTILSHLNS